MPSDLVSQLLEPVITLKLFYSNERNAEQMTALLLAQVTNVSYVFVANFDIMSSSRRKEVSSAHLKYLFSELISCYTIFPKVPDFSANDKIQNRYLHVFFNRDVET